MHVHRGSSREKKRTDTADSGIPSDSPSECIKDVEAEQWPKEQTRAGFTPEHRDGARTRSRDRRATLLQKANGESSGTRSGRRLRQRQG
jgi:hypothetical protein